MANQAFHSSDKKARGVPGLELQAQSRHKMEIMSPSLNHSFVGFSCLLVGWDLVSELLFCAWRDSQSMTRSFLLSALLLCAPDLVFISFDISSFSCFRHTPISSPELSILYKQELYLYSSFLEEFYIHNYNFSFYSQKQMNK